MAFFSERLPIPKNEEYLLGTDGKLGKRMKIEARPAIIREVEVEAILSVPVAKSLHMWLGERIKEAEVAATGGTPNVK